MPSNVCLVKAIIFPVVMYRYEIWTIKKSECQRIDAFEMWCWRRFLRVFLGDKPNPEPLAKCVRKGTEAI